jgi:hypothetical protein
MHQLKEVDLLSAKMDLLMKKLEDWVSEKKEVMHIHDSLMTCEVCGETTIQGTIVLKLKRMWTTSITIIIILNRIRDGISNRGQSTKVTFKVTIIIISINHPWEN